MSEVELKKEIKDLVEQESDLSVLLDVKQLLDQKKLKEVMIARALKADEDIKAGRLYTTEQVKKRLNLP